MTDESKCAVLGCDDHYDIQGVRLPGAGWIRLCATHIDALLATFPIEEKDIIIQE
jgi:hypothetical protein